MNCFMGTEPRALRRKICFTLSLTTGALMASMLTGCGLSLSPQPVPAIPPQPRGLRPAPRWVIDRMTSAAPDLYFDVNSHVLRRRERHRLDQIAVALQNILHDFPELIIVIEGHADDRGLIEYNDQLALERAEEVQRALWNISFPEDRLRTASFGYRAPQCRTQDELCRQKNRRVHFRAAEVIPNVLPGK